MISHAKTPVIAAAALLALIGTISGCDSTSGKGTRVTPSQAPQRLDGQQEYKSAQQLADDLNARGHRCDISPSGAGEYWVDSGRCYLGGSTGPEIVLGFYSS